MIFTGVIIMAATLESIYSELKLLRYDVQELKSLLVPEVEPDDDEIEAIKEGEKEFIAGEYTPWKNLKANTSDV